LQLRDRLARLPGVADVKVFGVGDYSMRVWLDTAQMRQRGLDPASVVNIISQQNQSISAGQIGMPPTPAGQQQQLTVTVDSPMTSPEDFGKLILLTASDGSITRLKDVARLELGSVDYNQDFHFDNKPSAGITIYQLPSANALDTSKAVRDVLDQAAKDFPQGMAYDVPFDTTVFVKSSIHEIYQTLIEAGVLVLIVILVFLQNWRATMVPATTIWARAWRAGPMSFLVATAIRGRRRPRPPKSLSWWNSMAERSSARCSPRCEAAKASEGRGRRTRFIRG
jgi:HAE1 family hydrophobic/amphiphilic exporter-1